MSSDFNALFNSLELLLFVLDMDGAIVYCNDTACNRLGYTRNELIGMPVVDIHPPEQRMFAGMLIQDMLDGKESLCPIPLQCKDKSKIQVETRVSQGSWQGKPALFGASKDVTVLKLIDEKYKTIFNSLPDLIAVLDLNYRIVSVNQAMADKLKVTREEAVGLFCHDIVHGTNCPPSFCPNRQLIKDWKSHSAEVYEPRLGGNYVVIVSPIFNERGDLSGSVHVAHDITEVKLSEKKFSTIFQFAPVALAITQISDGLILDVNDAWLYLMGYWKEDVIGKTSYELNIFTDIKDRDRIINKLKESHSIENEQVTLKTKQGKPVYGLFCGAPITINGIPCWITALNNQTNKVLLEQAIVDFKNKMVEEHIGIIE